MLGAVVFGVMTPRRVIPLKFSATVALTDPGPLYDTTV